VQKRDPSVIVRCSSVRTNVPEERRKPIVHRASRQESFQAGFSFDSNREQSGPGDAENTSQLHNIRVKRYMRTRTELG